MVSRICPLHLSRWELARQSCGGRFVAHGGQKWWGFLNIFYPVPGKLREALVPSREMQTPGGWYGSIVKGAQSSVPCSWH